MRVCLCSGVFQARSRSVISRTSTLACLCSGGVQTRSRSVISRVSTLATHPVPCPRNLQQTRTCHSDDCVTYQWQTSAWYGRHRSVWCQRSDGVHVTGTHGADVTRTHWVHVTGTPFVPILTTLELYLQVLRVLSFQLTICVTPHTACFLSQGAAQIY